MFYHMVTVMITIVYVGGGYSESISVESNRVVGYCRPQSSGPENSSLKKAGSSATR